MHYTLDESRSAEVAKRLLGTYAGIVLCDGYAAHESLARFNGSLQLANCWSHARRELFLDNPALMPDNNATERVTRGVVVGRKNHYGSRSVRGTKVAALFYSLLDSAQLAGVNPHQYLRTAVDAALAGSPIPLPHEIPA